MSCSVSHIKLILAIRKILGIRSGSRRLHHLIRSPGKGHIIILIRNTELGNGRMPVDSTPAQINVVRIIREDKRWRIGCVMIGLNHLFLTQRGNVAWLFWHTIVKTSLICMTGIEYHHALIRKDKECGIIVIIGLEIWPDEHLALTHCIEIILHGFNGTMGIYISQICHIDTGSFIFIM